MRSGGYSVLAKDIPTRVISSLVRFGSVMKDDMIELFFIAGVTTVTVGASLQWGSPIGMMVLGTLLLLAVANKLR